MRPNWLGLVVGVLAFGAALTPSLLPRPWLFEGVVAGLGAALGYGVGTFLSWLVRALRARELSATVKLWAWRLLAVLGSVAAVCFLLLGVGWQNEVRTLVGMVDEGLTTPFSVAIVALPVGIGAVLVGGVLRRLTGWIRGRLGRFLPRRLSYVLSAVVVVLLVYFAVTGLLFRGFVRVMDTVYSGTNASTRDGIMAPTSATRSGSPTSAVAWETLGMQGRNFVARGPSTQQLSAFTGKTPGQPIRVYAGLDSAPTAQDRAALAVRELERTGGFDRGVLVVAGTTGTGWLEPQSMDSIEYEWNGDSAIAGIQYSYLPSWISTLVDVDRAREAGTALYDAVYAHWSALPSDHRPKLIAYGLSLGSYSMQSPFHDAADLSTRAQGAVFVGSPHFSQPWERIAGDREPASPQWRPVCQHGQVVRFAGIPDDYALPAGQWGPPRVAYLQHSNDPVVWWSPGLLVHEPDWLREPPGPGRTPTMRWYPVLTFLQVTVDQFVAVSVPQGQGHNYGTQMPAALAAAMQPPGWTRADTARLDAIIAQMPLE